MTRRGLLTVLASLGARNAPAAAEIERIDSHVHIHRSAPELVSSLWDARWRGLSICVSDATAPADKSDLEAKLRETAALAAGSRNTLAWAATFDARDCEAPGFTERTIAALNQCFDRGALGVKVWKNVGLGIRTRSGAYLLPDHPALLPIYATIQNADRVLLVHLAGTSGGWMPIDERNPEYRYYNTHPEWNLYGRAGAPTKAEILAARDRVLARFPKLRVVGCHIGSQEDDLDGVARHLDAYPNLVVDTAAKVRYLVSAGRDKVRQFLLRYQDRVLYATDFSMGTDGQASSWKPLAATYERDWNFFAGLPLPERPLRQIFHDNAARCLRM